MPVQMRAHGPRIRFIAGNRNTESLTLNQAIEMALKNNLEARIEKIGVDIATGRMRYASGAFDPTLTLGASRESIRQPQNPTAITSASELLQQQTLLAQQENLRVQQSALIDQEQTLLEQERFIQGVIGAGVGTPLVLPQLPKPVPPLNLPPLFTQENPIIFDNESVRASADLKGRIPLGTTYGFTLGSARTTHSIVGFNRKFFPDNTGLAAVTVNQPLLRDFGFDANLAELRISRQNKKISQFNWALKVIDSVETVMIIYSDMYYSMENIRLKQDYVDANHKLVEANRRRLDLGLMSPIDLRQAQVSESVSQEELVVAKNLFMEKQFQLRRAILPDADVADDRVLVPTGREQNAVPKLDRMELMQEAFQNRVEYKAALTGVEIDDLRVRYARNQVLPKLDLVGSYGLNGLSTSMSRGLGKAFDGQAPQWSVGVVASMPLGNVQGRAQLAIAKNSKEQSMLKVKQTELAISVDVDTLISRISAHQQSVETARQSRRFAEEAVAIEQRRLEEGQVSTLDVVETQKKWFDARSRELAAQAALDNSIVQLWVATGTLLREKAIVIKD